MCDNSFGLAGVADVVNREAAVAPRAVAAIAGHDHVMQRVALALRRASAPRRAARFMPGSHHFDTISRLGDVLQIDDAQDVIGEAVEVRGDVRVAAAGPPQAIDADARHVEERDLARLGGFFAMS